MNLLIVDDEPLIHAAIEYSLKELGTADVMAYHAYNGAEMLRQMEERPFAAALVDISMPGMDGLTAIGTANGRWPQTMYYIMSGFSEFEYARQAVCLGVEEYLLKPLSPEDLEKVLKRVRQGGENQKQRLRDAFRSWLGGTLQGWDINYLYDNSHYAVLALLAYDDRHEQEALWTPQYVLEHHEAILSLPCKEGILLMAYSSSPTEINQIIAKLSKAVLPHGVTMLLSSASNDPERLSTQLRQLLTFSPVRCFTGIGQRYDAVTLPTVTPEQLEQAQRWISLRDMLFQQDYSGYMSALSSLHSLPDKQAQRDELRRYVEAITGEPVTEADTWEQLQAALTHIGQSLLHGQRRGDKLDAVLCYINEHYCQDISIASLSETFGLTPNYLSALLKSRTGVKFTDYLNTLRLTKARELLVTTGFSVREIMAQVGYYSQSHFNKIFLSKEGCTPAEFRSRHTS